jgi:GNAT superfamily N-acetyltransferase
MHCVIKALSKDAPLPSGIYDLLSEGEASGFRFLRRLVNDYEDGSNRFDATGEALYCITINQQLAGIGGVNAFHSRIGRIRRFYILKEYRRHGIGALLLEAIERHAQNHFERLELFTDSEAGSAFYQQCGYIQVNRPNVSHIKMLNHGFSRSTF